MAEPLHWSDPLAASRWEESLDEELARQVRRVREEQVALARILARANRSRHHRRSGCASLGEFGERFGLSEGEARELAVRQARERDKRQRALACARCTSDDGWRTDDRVRVPYLESRDRPHATSGASSPSAQPSTTAKLEAWLDDYFET